MAGVLRALAALLLLLVLARAAGLALVLKQARDVKLEPMPFLPAHALAAIEASGPRPSPGKFAVLGDPERGRSIFRRCLERAKEEGCEFVVITGDLVKDPLPLAFRGFISDLEETGWGQRFLVVRGNHDDRAVYEQFFGTSDWAIEMGDSLLLGIDNAEGLISDVQFDWVRARLAARPKGQRTFAFMHRPPFPYASQHEEDEPNDTAQEWEAAKRGDKKDDGEGDPRLAMLFVHEHVEWVLPSHYHAYERGAFEGVTQVISGGGGGNLDKPERKFHFLVVDAPPGSTDVRRVDVDAVRQTPRRLLEKIGLEQVVEWSSKRHKAAIEQFAPILLALLGLWGARRLSRVPQPAA